MRHNNTEPSRNLKGFLLALLRVIMMNELRNFTSPKWI